MQKGCEDFTFPLATCIVLSGVYEDDLDNANEIIYTGQGGNNLLGNRRQITAQTLLYGNLALKVSSHGSLDLIFWLNIPVVFSQLAFHPDPIDRLHPDDYPNWDEDRIFLLYRFVLEPSFSLYFVSWLPHKYAGLSFLFFFVLPRLKIVSLQFCNLTL